MTYRKSLLESRRVKEPAAVHAARSHGDQHSRELVEAWDALMHQLDLAEGHILVRHWGDYRETLELRKERLNRVRYG